MFEWSLAKLASNLLKMIQISFQIYDQVLYQKWPTHELYNLTCPKYWLACIGSQFERFHYKSFMKCSNQYKYMYMQVQTLFTVHEDLYCIVLYIYSFGRLDYSHLKQWPSIYKTHILPIKCSSFLIISLTCIIFHFSLLL